MPDGTDRPEPSAVPPGLSFRQLQSLLTTAHPDPIMPTPQAHEPWDQQLADWSRASQQLLTSLRQAGPAVAQGRTPRQLMALGAFQAHLAMALQAATASSSREHD